MTFDLVGFLHGCFQGRSGQGKIQLLGLGQHFQRVFRMGRFGPEIAVNTLLERFGLADVKQVAVGTQHPIDAGFSRQSQSFFGSHGINPPGAAGRLRRCEPVTELIQGANAEINV